MKDIKSSFSSELEIVIERLVSNKLSLHLGNTESILFGSKHRLKSRLKSQSNLNISCKGQSTEAKDSIKYLRATIDQTLSFEPMARSVLSKVNGRLRFLFRKAEFLSSQTKKLLVMSIIQCHVDYASTVWFYSTTQSLIDIFQITQNKIIRFVLNLDLRSQIKTEHFYKLGWLLFF